MFTAVFAPLIATHAPDGRLLGVEPGVTQRGAPCIHLLGCPADKPEHIFGTDGNFRDVFSRVVYGARTSLVIGLAAIGFAILVGTMIGALAGYIGGWVDNVLMRLMDVVLAFPSLLLAIAIVTAVGPSLINALFAIGIVSDADLCPGRPRRPSCRPARATTSRRRAPSASRTSESSSGGSCRTR